MGFVFLSKDKIREDKTSQSCRVPHRAVHSALLNDHPWEHRWVVLLRTGHAVASAAPLERGQH